MNSKPNHLILKEPRGFIKIIELVIVIFAFATCAGFIGNFEFTETCPPGGKNVSISHKVQAKFYYPFDTMDIYHDEPLCTNEKGVVRQSLDSVFKSSSQFFVFTGVVAMLFVFVAVVFYVFFEDQDKDAVATDIGICSFPVVDFGFSIVLALFWFCGSIAWASALAGLKDKTNVETYTRSNCLGSCSVSKHATYGAANVSVVFGFLNFFVWAGNLWFLFKETPWHSPRAGGARPPGEGGIPQEPPRQETPPASI